MKSKYLHICIIHEFEEDLLSFCKTFGISSEDYVEQFMFYSVIYVLYSSLNSSSKYGISNIKISSYTYYMLLQCPILVLQCI